MTSKRVRNCARVVDPAERLQRRGDAIMAEANVALGDHVASIEADNPLANGEAFAKGVERLLMAALGQQSIADPVVDERDIALRGQILRIGRSECLADQAAALIVAARL